MFEPLATSIIHFLPRLVRWRGPEPDRRDDSLYILAAGVATRQVRDDLWEELRDIFASQDGLDVLVHDIETGVTTRISGVGSQ
jgi:hypothetical protein